MTVVPHGFPLRARGPHQRDAADHSLSGSQASAILRALFPSRSVTRDHQLRVGIVLPLRCGYATSARAASNARGRRFAPSRRATSRDRHAIHPTVRRCGLVSLCDTGFEGTVRYAIVTTLEVSTGQGVRVYEPVRERLAVPVPVPIAQRVRG